MPPKPLGRSNPHSIAWAQLGTEAPATKATAAGWLTDQVKQSQPRSTMSGGPARAGAPLGFLPDTAQCQEACRSDAPMSAAGTPCMLADACPTQKGLCRVTTRRVRHAEHLHQREQRWAHGPGYVDTRLQLRIDLRREAEVVGERKAGEAAEEVGVQGLAADVQPGQGNQRVRPACSLAAWRTAALCSQHACYSVQQGLGRPTASVPGTGAARPGKPQSCMFRLSCKSVYSYPGLRAHRATPEHAKLHRLPRAAARGLPQQRIVARAKVQQPLQRHEVHLRCTLDSIAASSATDDTGNSSAAHLALQAIKSNGQARQRLVSGSADVFWVQLSRKSLQPRRLYAYFVRRTADNVLAPPATRTSALEGTACQTRSRMHRIIQLYAQITHARRRAHTW